MTSPKTGFSRSWTRQNAASRCWTSRKCGKLPELTKSQSPTDKLLKNCTGIVFSCGKCEVTQAIYCSSAVLALEESQVQCREAQNSEHPRETKEKCKAESRNLKKTSQKARLPYQSSQLCRVSTISPLSQTSSEHLFVSVLLFALWRSKNFLVCPSLVSCSFWSFWSQVTVTWGYFHHRLPRPMKQCERLSID